jgi:hypothetical protein
MSGKDEHKLYEKILDILLVLRETQKRFQPYSANDIKKVIASKMKSVHKDPPDLRELYKLEEMIFNLRTSMELAKSELSTPVKEPM